LPNQAISNEEIFAEDTYQNIMALLDKEDIFLSYNDLLKIYETITTSEDQIPGMEKILRRLMQERNEHPRVDQMIIIFTAKLIGGSQHEIAHISKMFEDLMQNKRANLWTMSFVAKALGDYFIDLKDGDYLADLLDDRIESLIEQESNSTDEYYGFHFLPPPTDIYIKNIISRPEEQKRREYTRRYYYILRSQHSEEQIKNYLLFLDKHGQINSNRKIGFSMKYLFNNLEVIQAAIAQEQKGELSSKNRLDQQQDRLE
jgi:hypothetical protein